MGAGAGAAATTGATAAAACIFELAAFDGAFIAIPFEKLTMFGSTATGTAGAGGAQSGATTATALSSAPSRPFGPPTRGAQGNPRGLRGTVARTVGVLLRGICSRRDGG